MGLFSKRKHYEPAPAEEEFRPLSDSSLFAAFGPMRCGEICALDSDHINGNIVHVEYSMALDEYGNWVRNALKSLSGDRYIEFLEFVTQ